MVHNVGTAPLEAVASIEGDAQAQFAECFSLAADAAFTVPAGAAHALLVQCAGASVGVAYGALCIASGDTVYRVCPLLISLCVLDLI
jgi:hypothetical protein